MQTDLNLGVSTLFRDATKQNLMQSLKTNADWDAFNKIDRTARDAEQAENIAFKRDKPGLVAKELEKVINEAGSRQFQHPAPFGSDRFSKSANQAEALRRVEHAHENRLTKIRDEEGLAYATLNQTIRARDQSRGMATQEFTRVTDRRDGLDRRLPTRS